MSGGVPAGWVLVPVEPSGGQLEAGLMALSNAGVDDACVGDARNAYYAMLDAAPATPTPPIEGPTAQSVYEAIKHGDAEHCAWLQEALTAIWRGEEVPPPRGKGTGTPPIEGRDADVERVAKGWWEREQQIVWEGTGLTLPWSAADASARAKYLDCARAALQALGERG